MQSEQSTTQIKKSTSVKKDKKVLTSEVLLNDTLQPEVVPPKKLTKSKKTVEQVPEPVVQLVSEPVVQLVSEPVVQLVSEPVVQLVHEPVVQLVVEPVVQQSSELVSEVVLQETDISSFLDFMNTTSDRFSEFTKFLKDSSFSKDERSKVDTSFKKFSKAVSVYQFGYFDNLSRQISHLEKTTGNKVGSVKKVQDKEKSAIHKKLTVHPFLLNFMKLEQGTSVSRSDVLTAITGYVAKEKVSNPSILVENDKRSFKLIGELKPLFDGIESIMKSKGLLNDSNFPTEIKYTQIMQYMTHCFIKTESPTVV